MFVCYLDLASPGALNQKEGGPLGARDNFNITIKLAYLLILPTEAEEAHFGKAQASLSTRFFALVFVV